MSTVSNIGQLISRDPQYRDGKPCIAGTGITVHRIVGWYKHGMSPEEIARDYPHMSLAQVYAALAFYHANSTQIDDEMRVEQAEEERIYAEHRQRMGKNP